jgi:glycosyltransferase involved in cell wall biosynthesis
MKAGRALILVENLSVPLDRRVWQESQTLASAGWAITVLCPRGRDRDTSPYEEIDGVAIHRFDLAPAQGGARAYLREYTQAFARIARHVRRLSAGGPFDVIQACNPPDLLLVAALPQRHRSAFVFDHHDLVPELYLSRFSGNRDLVYRALRAAERLTFALADVVIATNESYREIALTRGAKRSGDVFVVRNGPDLERFSPGPPTLDLKRGKPYLVAYVGMMGPQDGVGDAVQALAELRRRRQDWHAVFAGDGDERRKLELRARELGLNGSVEFTGLLSQDDVQRLLRTADVCLAPEPKSPLNDLSTMMKVAEYMAMGRAVVATGLPETRRTAAEAAQYVEPGNIEAMTAALAALLDDEPRRRSLGEQARRRAVVELGWDRSAEALVAAYERARQKRVARRSRGIVAS